MQTLFASILFYHHVIPMPHLRQRDFQKVTESFALAGLAASAHAGV